jgi:hypothetical protein
VAINFAIEFINRVLACLIEIRALALDLVARASTCEFPSFLLAKTLPPSLFLLLREYLPGPARPGNESCYLDRHIGFCLAVGELQVVNPGRFEHLQVEGVPFEGLT